MSSPMTTADVGVVQRTNTLAALTMLEHALPVLTIEKVASPYKMPKNRGKNIKFRRLDQIATNQAPLVEGRTPTGTKITFTDVEVTMQQYGDWTPYTDQIEDFHEDDIGRQISIAQGENAARIIEAVMWGRLRAGTSVFFANGSARTDVNTPITRAKLQAVTRALKAQGAMKFTSMIMPSVNFGTTGVEASYIALAHTDTEKDIRDIPTFRPVVEYGSAKPISEHELGTVDDVRFILSRELGFFPDGGGAKGAMVSTTGTSADVYPVVIMGKEAFHAVSLRGREAIEVMTRKPGTPMEGDPLGQRGTYGWKTYHASKITNESWIQRLEVAVTAL